MCLSTVTKRYRKPSRQIRTGYKYLVRTMPCGEGWRLPFQWFNVESREDEVIFGKWYRARREQGDTALSDDDKIYTLGFHCFKTLKGAKRWTARFNRPKLIVKVDVKGVHTHGTQDGVPVLVARWVRFHEPGK